MPTEQIITALKVYGGAAYYSSMRTATAEVGKLDQAQSRLATGSRRVGEGLDNMVNNLGRASAKMAGFAAVAVGWTAKTGIFFDAMMERTEIGIKTMVGSAEEARKITNSVREFALEAPLFGVETMMQTTQQLIGAGYDAKNITPYLRTFSDTLSAMGRRPEDLKRMTYAFVQMMNKGKISSEELQQQLGEIFPAAKILAREMGLTSDELADKMKKGSVKGKEAIFLLLRGMEKDYGGATKEMAKTFDGQLANLRESAKYTLGILFEPLFKSLRDDVFPLISKFGTVWVDTLKDNTLTSEEKFRITGELFNAYIMPKVHEFLDTLERMDIGTKIGAAMNKALPVVASSMGKLATEAMKAFGKAWWESDIWGKLFLGSILFSKIVGFKALFGAIGRRAAAWMAAQFATTLAAEKTLTMIGDSGKVGGRRFGKTFGFAAAAAAVLFLGVALQDQLEKGNIPILSDFYKKLGPKKGQTVKEKNAEDWEKVKDAAKGALDWMAESFKSLKPVNKPFDYTRRQLGGPAQAGRPYVVGERRPELFVPSMAGSIKPSLGGAFVIHNYVTMDGRVAAYSVARHNQDQIARR